MTTFRWLVLRLFWSLLLAPWVALGVLWVLHELIFRNLYLYDSLFVLFSISLVVPFVSWLLTREGLRRFEFLHQKGRALIESENPAEIHEALRLMLRVLESGLLSNHLKDQLSRRLLRSYFPFYAGHTDSKEFREQLLLALKQRVRSEEAYNALKAHVLIQSPLTLEVAELAEELLEIKPEDSSLATFFAQHFLAEKKIHFRAEYFYQQILAQRGPLSPAIVQLCLERILQQNRHDDFAAWCCVRAFEQHGGGEERLRQSLFHLHRRMELLQRNDELSRKVAECFAKIPVDEILQWEAPAVQQRQASLPFRVQRVAYALHEYGLDLLTLIRREWRWAIAGGAGVLIAAVLYVALPSASSKKLAVESAPVEDENNRKYFSLQVGAVKNLRSAEKHLSPLTARGLEVYLLEPQSQRGWYRIRVGKYRSQNEARFAADSLKSAGIISDYFVSNYDTAAQIIPSLKAQRK